MPLIELFAVVLVVSVAGLLVLGSARAGGRALGTRVALAFGGWLALTGALAAAGVFAHWSPTQPPRLLLSVAGAMIVFALVARRLGPALHAIPQAWIVGLQTFRVPVELGLWALFLAGAIPRQMTFEGRNIDVLAGLTAPIVALAVARGWIGRRGLIAWNLLGLATLANIVGVAITSMPGPLQLAWPPGPANTIVAELPFVWLPAFLVPTALFGHVLSLRRLRASRSTLENVTTVPS